MYRCQPIYSGGNFAKFDPVAYVWFEPDHVGFVATLKGWKIVHFVVDVEDVDEVADGFDVGDS